MTKFLSELQYATCEWVITLSNWILALFKKTYVFLLRLAILSTLEMASKIRWQRLIIHFCLIFLYIL